MTSIQPAAPAQTAAVRDADSLLDMRSSDLDALFQNRPPGEIPQGTADGTIVWLPGTWIARPVSRVLGAIVWRGKVFSPSSGDLKNRLGPTGIPAIRAEVGPGVSWLDDRPCVLLDYSRSSRVAGWIRDEIREVSPGVYLGLAWGVGRMFGGRKLLLRFALTFRSGA
jgi:hypothetical protein